MSWRRPLALASLLAACGGEVTAPLPDAPAAVASSEPLAAHLDWWISLINQRHGVAPRDEAKRHFRRTGHAETDERYRDIAEKYAPLTLLGVRAGDPGIWLADAESPVGHVEIVLETDDRDGRLRGVRVWPRLDSSLPELMRRVQRLGSRAQFLVAEIVAGQCHPVYAANADQPLPLASVFKLYVLLALVDHILAGEATWDDPLAIRDDWKSLPSGTMQDLPAGKVFSLRTYARHMIAGSDNTATDHLLYTLGRAAVEAAVHASGHHAPSLNIPLLSTREVYLFWHLRPELVDLYLRGTEAGRRAYLDRALAGLPATAVSRRQARSSRSPTHVDTIGWFATPLDLCGVMATLLERAHTHPEAAPLLDVLAATREVGLARTTWPFMGQKTGGVPGARAHVALLRRDDDREFAVVIGYSDPTQEIDRDATFPIAWRIFERLALHDR